MDKNVTEEELETKYVNHYDKNIAFKLLKKLRAKTRDKPGILSKPTGVVINGLGHLISALDNPSLPKSEKLKIMGAIGYVILPVDLIPDSIPVVGYTDDATVVGLMVQKIRAYSTFSMNELDAEIDGVEYTVENADVQLPAVVEKEISEEEPSSEEIQEVETDERGNLTVRQFEENVQKSQQLFQKFLDKNAELDNEFSEQNEKSEKLSDEMWNSISRL